MKNEKEILQLCVSNDSLHPNTETPFTQGEYVFATDGVIALRVSKNLIEGEYEERLQPNARSVFGQPENETEITLSAIKDLLSNVELIDEKRAVGEDIKCKECDGHGTVCWEYKHHEKELDCPECYGTGYSEEASFILTGNKIPDPSGRVPFGDIDLRCDYVDKIAKTMEFLGVETATMGRAYKHFGCPPIFNLMDGVDILLMPLSK